MKRTVAWYLSIAVTLLVIFAGASASAGSDCKLQGSWIGTTDGQVTFIATYAGQSASSGTSDLEFPQFNVFGITSVRGVWERVGPKTFSYSIVGFVYDETGTVTAIAKNSGIKVMSEDCNSIEVNSTTSYYSPEDYLLENPGAPISEPTEHEYRIMVDPQ